MSTSGPGNLPPQQGVTPMEVDQTEENNSGSLLGKRNGREITKTDADSIIPKQTKRRKGPGIKLSGLTSAKPLVTLNRTKETSADTALPPEVSQLWSHLEGKRKDVHGCNPDTKQPFSFDITKIPEKTAVSLQQDEGTLPYNFITLKGQVIGIAARGPSSTPQREAFFKAAMQNNSQAIVNLSTPLEGGLTDYVPKQGTANYGAMNVSTTEISESSHDRMTANLQITSGNNTATPKYLWLGNIGNRAAGSADDLIALSRKTPEGPIMVHCRFGIGRTAMFMLTHRLNQLAEAGMTKEELIPALATMIQEGRECRGQFLENPGQLDTVIKAGASIMKVPVKQVWTGITEYLSSNTL